MERNKESDKNKCKEEYKKLKLEKKARKKKEYK